MAASCAGGQAAPVVSSIKRGAALRLTYKLLDKPMTIIPDLVAQHPDNRGGIAINSARTDELLLHVLGHYDEEEACHGAVAVEERPGGCAIRVYNLQKQAGNPALAGVSDAAIPYGSVGSSHINQVLRNIKFGAKTEVAPEIQDNEGKLNIDKCAGVDPALAESCSKGLRWEVLSWKIEEEEDGILSVQAGLNDRAAAQMMEHEMQCIRQLAKYCEAEANAAGEVKAGAVLSRLIAVGASALAESPGFLHLFRFVIEQGGE